MMQKYLKKLKKKTKIWSYNDYTIPMAVLRNDEKNGKTIKKKQKELNKKHFEKNQQGKVLKVKTKKRARKSI